MMIDRTVGKGVTASWRKIQGADFVLLLSYNFSKMFHTKHRDDIIH